MGHRAARGRLRDLAVTGAAALSAGAVASSFGLPVAWLLGPVVAATALSLAGLDTRLPDRLKTLAFYVLGVQAGSGVSPEIATQFAVWPLSFVIQLFGVLFAVALCYGFLRRMLGWDHATALFASLPGALSFVVAAASETKADMGRVVIIQSIRLLMLIAALVPLLGALEGGGAMGPALRPAGDGGVFAYALMFGLSAATAWLAARLNVPGGMMLGALIGSAVLHGADVVAVSLPWWLALPSLVLLGIIVGGRLNGISVSAFLRLLAPSLGCFALGLLGTGLAGVAAVVFVDLPAPNVALAYAPGALEALTVLAFQFDIDPAYVASHHVVRFFAIALIVPFLARRVSRREAVTERAEDGTAAAPAPGEWDRESA
ncbi:AbrB family transcriptional regulator [Jiella sonneratiae]|uniref:AbrB family transcriptional regulator n=1 Tax=Jiella sonneratiae TaxID=2816856 RepID=A0ABS3J4P1_9HYPH|nr:AbrB family transcriptional regulator [Jiella sonneratiae]MBO0904622.1 AbrB family transcriptional regulator [Jiella sonneratiae]